MVAGTDDPTTPAIDGFIPGHAISYRLWKGGTETSAVTPAYVPATPVPTFTSLGSTVLSLTAVSATSQVVPLTAGWNIISLAVVPPAAGMLQILQPLIDGGKLVKVQDEQGNALEQLPGIGWINSIGSWSATEGYYLRVTTSGSLNVTGSPVPLPLQIPLSNGWNILGYPRSTPVNALTAFQPLITQNRLVKVQDESGNALENLPVLGWVNNIGNLRTGEGYYLRVNAAVSLTFAADGSTSGSSAVASVPAAGHYVPVFAGNPFGPMNVYLRLGMASGIQPGGEVGLFDGNRCVGSVRVTQDHLEAALLPVVAGMDDPATEEIDGFVPGHTVRVVRWDGAGDRDLVYECAEGDGVVFAERGSTVLTPRGESPVPASVLLLEGYPNPFNPATTIRYVVPVGGTVQPGESPAGGEAVDVRLGVFDLLGREVALLVRERQLPGAYQVLFSGAGLASGVYTCRLQAGNRSAMLRLALVR
jgi:hypothetical protein